MDQLSTDKSKEYLNEKVESESQPRTKSLFFFGQLRRSKATRVLYITIIFIVIFIGILMITPQITGWLQRIFCRDFSYYICDMLIGYDAVYRLCFALAVWFFILTFVTIGVSSSVEKRARIQNNFWPSKLLGLLLIEFLFLIIPHTEYNGEVWIFFGLNGAFCYIILQYTFILDAANSFNIFSEAVTRNEDGEFSQAAMSWFRIAKSFTTTFFYTVSLLSSVVLYYSYASRPGCLNNLTFLVFHLIMSFSASTMAVLPVLRDVSSQSGLFQSSVTSLYCTYLIWLAFSSEPDDHCNPWNAHRYPGPPTTNVQVYVTLFITFGTLVYISVCNLVAPQYGKVNVAETSENLAETSDNHPNTSGETSVKVGGESWSSVDIGKYDSITSSVSEKQEPFCRGKNPFAPSPQTSPDHLYHSPENKLSVEKSSEPDNGTKNASFVWDDERDGVEYSYSFFHLTFCLATIYLMMSITNWYRLDEGEHFTVRLIRSWSAVWLRISASIFCSFIFIWSMIVPLVFPDSYRDLLFFQYLTSLAKT